MSSQKRPHIDGPRGREPDVTSPKLDPAGSSLTEVVVTYYDLPVESVDPHVQYTTYDARGDRTGQYRGQVVESVGSDRGFSNAAGPAWTFSDLRPRGRRSTTFRSLATDLELPTRLATDAVPAAHWPWPPARRLAAGPRVA